MTEKQDNSSKPHVVTVKLAPNIRIREDKTERRKARRRTTKTALVVEIVPNIRMQKDETKRREARRQPLNKTRKTK